MIGVGKKAYYLLTYLPTYCSYLPTYLPTYLPAYCLPTYLLVPTYCTYIPTVGVTYLPTVPTCLHLCCLHRWYSIVMSPLVPQI